MPFELEHTVKKPLTEIESEIRKKLNITSPRTDAYIKDDQLVLVFGGEATIKQELLTSTPSVIRGKRRKKGKRNRMKTRGWEIVGTVLTENGLKANVYRPFIDALKEPNLSITEMKKRVKEILEKNRNKPQENNIAYFLENSLKYLKVR